MGFKVRYSETHEKLTEPKTRLIMKMILDDPYHFKNLREAWKRHMNERENLVSMPGIEKLEMYYKKGE